MRAVETAEHRALDSAITCGVGDTADSAELDVTTHGAG
jgi:hypothetical protein